MKNIRLLIIAIIFFSVFLSYAFAQALPNSSNEFNMEEIESMIPSSELIIYGEVIQSTRESVSNSTYAVDYYSAKVKVNETYKGKKYDYIYLKNYRQLKPGLTIEKVERLTEETNKTDELYDLYLSVLQIKKQLRNIEMGRNYTFILVNCYDYDDNNEIKNNEVRCYPKFSVEGKIWEDKNRSFFIINFLKSHYPIVILFLFYFFYILWKIKNYFKSKN